MIKEDIGEESFSLHYYHAPSFANPEIFTTLQGLEQQQLFSLEIVSSGVTLPIDEFSKLVTQRFEVTVTFLRSAACQVTSVHKTLAR